MASKTSPAIVGVAKFSGGKSEAFTGYIQYMDRDEAIRNKEFKKYNLHEYDGYHRYMDNPEKTGGLFTAHKDTLTINDKKLLRNQFMTAQENDSVMWQDVISFDNKWLASQGYYNPETGWLDEDVLMKAVRHSQERMLENEGMGQSAVWSAAIHYNTKNIHIHIATVEPTPTRMYQEYRDKKTGEKHTARRGYRHRSTIDLMKTRMMSQLVDRSAELKKISELTRSTFVPKKFSFRDLHHAHFDKLYQKIYNKLPSDKRLWKYNMNGLSDVRPLINEFLDDYISTYHASEFSELDKLLDDQVKQSIDLYGVGNKEVGRAEEYKENKLNELRTTLGNALLNDMSLFEKEERQSGYTFSAEPTTSHHHNIGFTLQSLSRSFKQFSKTNKRNQHKYRQLIEEQDKER